MRNEDLFKALYIDLTAYATIRNDHELAPKELTTLEAEYSKQYAGEIAQIRRIRNIYNNKKKLDGFSFGEFPRFYEWYLKQHAEQKGECYYCHTPEHIIRELCLTTFNGKIRDTRGKNLEVERKDSVGNEYNEDNCVLACYFCNNDKSNVFDEDEYREYLIDRKSFFESKYEELKRGK